MIGRAKSLRRDECGTGTIELALSAPILAFLLVGAVDMGAGYTQRLALQQAANRTLETGMARGRVSDSYSYLQAIGAANSGLSASNVTIDSWLECDFVRATSFDGTCGSNQQSGRYISVKITGTHTPSFNYNGLARRFGSTNLGGSVVIAGFAAVRIQ
jgi:Flp pilus assembly protein TadG